MTALVLFVVAMLLTAVLSLLTARPGLRVALGVSAGALALIACILAPFEARKLAGLALMPTGVVWLGLAVLAILLWRQRRRRLGAAACALWLVLGTAGNGHVAALLLGFLEHDYAAAQPLASGPFDVAFVLGGGVSISSEGRVGLVASSDRVLLASRLVRAGRTPVLAVSGPYIRLADGRRWSYPRAAAQVLEEMGVPPAAIVLVEGPRATGEEVARYARLARERGWRRMAVISSGWHLPRVLRHCRRHQLVVTPLASDLQSGPRVWRLRDVIPNANALEGTSLALWEVLGSLAGY